MSAIASERVRLGPWVAASLATHGLLLAMFWPSGQPLPGRVQNTQPVTVALLDASSSGDTHAEALQAHEDVREPRRQRQPERAQALAASRPVVEREERVAPSPLTDDAAPVRSSDTLQSANSEAASQIVAAGIETRIRAQLERAKFYPSSARRRGIEGDVQVGFRLTDQGQAEQVLVLAGSGYAILDRAALETVARAQPFPPGTGQYQFHLRFQRL